MRKKGVVTHIPVHGTAHSYEYYGCHCDDCTKEAYRIKNRRVRRSRHNRDIPSYVQHGKVSTYNNWGCHCDECKAANTEYSREYKRR